MCRSMFLITNVRVHNPELAPDLTDYRALFGAGGELGQSLHDCRLCSENLSRTARRSFLHLSHSRQTPR